MPSSSPMQTMVPWMQHQQMHTVATVPAQQIQMVPRQRVVEEMVPVRRMVQEMVPMPMKQQVVT